MNLAANNNNTFAFLPPNFRIIKSVPVKRFGMDESLTLSQCTLVGPVYTEMQLVYHWLTQCTLGYHWTTRRILAGYTGTPLEKFIWNCRTFECHLRSSGYCSLHWNTTGGTVGKWPDPMTSKLDAVSILGYHWTNYTGTRLADGIAQLSSSGNPVLICIIGTHWKTTGATSTLGCHWNNTGWC